MENAFNPNVWKAEVGGSLWFWGLPGVQSEFQGILDLKCPLPPKNLPKDTKSIEVRLVPSLGHSFFKKDTVLPSDQCTQDCTGKDPVFWLG